MFGLGWLIVLVLKPRLVPRGANKRVRNSVLKTNLALAGIAGSLCVVAGWRAYLLAQAPIFMIAGAVGVWLFYVQHQFEDTYWQQHADWRYEDARRVRKFRRPRIHG
jgi:acyl-lipid omega-6 desaturase (Delta-12 desaturase)